MAKEEVSFVGMLLGGEPCHVVDKSEYRHVDFRVAEHRYAFAGIGKGNLLGVLSQLQYR